MQEAKQTVFELSPLQKAAEFSGFVSEASPLCFFEPEQSADASPTYPLPQPRKYPDFFLQPHFPFDSHLGFRHHQMLC